jgi:hypothetical protein
VFVEEVYNSSSIDTSHLSSGLYIMKIEKDGKINTKKIVKN